jgi:hypothetical protein
VEGTEVIESPLLLVSGPPLGSRSSPGSSMSAPGEGSWGSSVGVAPPAGRDVPGVGEGGADGVGEGTALGRADGVGEGFGVAGGRDGSGCAEDFAELSGTTRYPSRKYAYQALTVLRYASEWL